LEIDFDTQIDIWLTYRSGAKRIARIRRTIDWLIQAYDPRRFPGSGMNSRIPPASRKSTKARR
jgi:hypothetical protein